MSKLDIPDGFTLNPGDGAVPAEAVGKRVRVILRNPHGGGLHEPRYADENTQAVPSGWAADGRGGCRWRIGRAHSPFDVVAYKVMG
jgi:hypothetical protein